MFKTSLQSFFSKRQKENTRTRSLVRDMYD